MVTAAWSRPNDCGGSVGRRWLARARRIAHHSHTSTNTSAPITWTELTDAYDEIDTALEDKHWWTDPPHDLSQQLWATYRPALAAFLDGHAWDHLADAYGEIACFNRHLTIARDGKDSIHHGTNT
jgi:hypothetical protein